MLGQQSPKMWRHTHVLEWRLIELALGLLVLAVIFGVVWYITTSVRQAEVQPAGFVNTYAPLDQHERHPAGYGNTYAPLDQHERHPAGFGNTYPPLDFDDRYPLPSFG